MIDSECNLCGAIVSDSITHPPESCVASMRLLLTTAEARFAAVTAERDEWRGKWIEERNAYCDETEKLRARAGQMKAERDEVRARLAEEKTHMLADEERLKLTGDALWAEGVLAEARAAWEVYDDPAMGWAESLQTLRRILGGNKS